jgi:hypothetical protein
VRRSAAVRSVWLSGRCRSTRRNSTRAHRAYKRPYTPSPVSLLVPLRVSLLPPPPPPSSSPRSRPPRPSPATLTATLQPPSASPDPPPMPRRQRQQRRRRSRRSHPLPPARRGSCTHTDTAPAPMGVSRACPRYPTSTGYPVGRADCKEVTRGQVRAGGSHDERPRNLICSLGLVRLLKNGYPLGLTPTPSSRPPLHCHPTPLTPHPSPLTPHRNHHTRQPPPYSTFRYPLTDSSLVL